MSCRIQKGKGGKKYALLAAVLLSAGLLGGCGGEGKNIQSAMESIRNLDYQGALLQLDSAAESGENLRLIDRARGIAYMGLTDYEQAAACFEAALAGSNGWVENVDFDLNFYLHIPAKA